MSVAISPEQYCGAKKHGQDATCRQWAGWGTNHPGAGRCKLHGGSGPGGEVHGQRLLANMEARKALESLAVPITIDPESALLGLVYEAAGNVAFLGGQVANLGGELVGDVHQLSRDGEAIPVSEEVRAIVKLYGEERDRLAKVSKMALDAGIAKRAVEMAEQHGQQIAVTVINVLTQLNLPAEIAAQARVLLAAEFRQQARVVGE